MSRRRRSERFDWTCTWNSVSWTVSMPTSGFMNPLRITTTFSGYSSLLEWLLFVSFHFGHRLFGEFIKQSRLDSRLNGIPIPSIYFEFNWKLNIIFFFLQGLGLLSQRRCCGLPCIYSRPGRAPCRCFLLNLVRHIWKSSFMAPA